MKLMNSFKEHLRRKALNDWFIENINKDRVNAELQWKKKYIYKNEMELNCL